MTAALLALHKRTFASLRRHRNYRLFFTGQVISVSGTWMQNVALAWLVIELTESPLAVGALAFCRFIPFTIFGLVAGVVADRLDNRRLVIGTQASQMVVSTALAVLVLTDTATVPLVFALALLGGVALVFDAPGRHALTFQLVGREELPNAVALNASLFNASRVIGPAIAGVVIAAVGVGACFVVNTFSFLAVLAALLLMRVGELFPIERAAKLPTVFGGIREGFAYALGTTRVRVVLILVTVVSTVGFNFHVILPLLASDTLHTGPEVFGLLSAAFGLGALVGALMTAAARPGQLETAPPRHDHVQPVAAGPGTRPPRRARRRPVVRHGRVVHAVDVEREHDPAAQRPGRTPRPRRQPVPLRLRRLRAARRPLRRLARRGRRHGAELRRRRCHGPGGDRLRRPRRGNHDPAAAGGFTRPKHAQHAGLTDPEHNKAR